MGYFLPICGWHYHLEWLDGNDLDERCGSAADVKLVLTGDAITPKMMMLEGYFSARAAEDVYDRRCQRYPEANKHDTMGTPSDCA